MWSSGGYRQAREPASGDYLPPTTGDLSKHIMRRSVDRILRAACVSIARVLEQRSVSHRRRVAQAIMGDIPQQLATLLGRRRVANIRKTDEDPSRISVIDVAMAITGGSQHDAARILRRLSEQYPEVGLNWPHLKFKGRGQRSTPVTGARGIVEVVMLLPGHHATRVRRQVSELLCRYLGGDLSLVGEVCRMHGLQEELGAARPDDPRRIFGEAVEAASGSAGHVGQQVARMCTMLQERIGVQIDERLAAYAREHAEVRLFNPALRAGPQTKLRFNDTPRRQDSSRTE